jgi:hypothetical protein
MAPVPILAAVVAGSSSRLREVEYGILRYFFFGGSTDRTGVSGIKFPRLRP